ncbi:MAG: S-layer homology domain-containing protein [Candidatus Delongbacteria bacterium]|nr:S-layer homology domain-containing protein [Candidatus Delongbacteria bacterium]MCG2760101.1 S-layer homology domain-containing protein [Candidatus Delongbacteria bacterium]
MKKLMILLTAVSLFILISCSQETRKSESVLDSPEMHISIGMKYFNDGNYDDAKKEFDDAIKIDWKKKEDKAGAYAGLGMYFAVTGDKNKAKDNAKEAVGLNSKLPLAYTCYGRTIMFMNKGIDGDEWIEDAVEEFDEAVKLADEQRDNIALAEAYYFKGIAGKNAYKFTMAKSAFAEVVKLKGLYATEANKEWEIVQMIERARPGTKIGAKVALLNEVGKAEIAVLFVEEMKIEQVLDKREKKEYNNEFAAPADPLKYTEAEQKKEPANDISGNWALSWIKIVLNKGVMENAPDHKFYPDKKITRAEYALMLLKVMVLISGDESLYTKHFGEENSMFNDVRTDHYAYNAMAVCASRGIMKANINGEFGKDKTVSGAEALLIIRDFQNALSITF